ncbi:MULTISPECIES: methyltransferase family protein [Nocardioides]|uniref:Methyltransferase family protein n=1 Tax=Nocardioides vastitatis TaxID=2568655 RepID=A0ABW0ZM84_9ACTN|nr:isoprenylcysteine carboxylmethyltransferase family protein [Nocardioides sp.]THI93502.1 isoprenylcysteine carboxylmethyltransferase family protein [Nocardioides sp.]
MPESAVRIVAAVMALANVAVVILVLLWERPGRAARIRTPAQWRVPRVGTLLMVLPLAYPVVVVVAPGWLTWRASTLLHVAGLVLWALGCSGVLWCVRVMRGQTGADGVVEGHRLVTTGPYRFVRHPMYVAILATSGGSAIAIGSYVVAMAALAFVPVAVSWAATEERLLVSSELGQQYQEYERHAGRLVPRLRRR